MEMIAKEDTMTDKLSNATPRPWIKATANFTTKEGVIATAVFSIGNHNDEEPRPADAYGATSEQAQANAELIVKAVNQHDELVDGMARLAILNTELVEVAKYAQEVIRIARRYFPKSIKNRDRFNLENTCAAIGKTIFKAEGKLK